MAIGDKKSAVMQSDLGIAGGVATLDSNGKLAQMPTYIDVNAAPGGFGLGTTSGKKLNTDNDLNQIKEIGFYYWHDQAPANAPLSYAKMLVWSAAGSYITQLVNGYSDSVRNRIYIRSNIGSGVWSDWQVIYSRDELLKDFVKKSGDTMTNTLTVPMIEFNNGNNITRMLSQKFGCYINVGEIGQDQWQLFINNPRDDTVTDTLKNALLLCRSAGGIEWDSTYHILHTGNKPSGSYTGNGNTTERTIETNGIGSAVVITSPNGTTAILTPVCGVLIKTSSITAIPYGTAHITWATGMITIATADSALNASGVTYSYHVL